MKYIIVLLSLILFGCSAEQISKMNKEHDDGIIKTIYYKKDKRTGLCFASWGLGGNGGLLTNVPCTPEVEKLIK